MAAIIWPGERRIVVPTTEGALLRPKSQSDEDLLTELMTLASAHRRLRSLKPPQGKQQD